MRFPSFTGVLYACALISPALAQSSWTWKASQTGTQAWSSGSNWQFDANGNGNSSPQTAGDVANFQVNIGADTVVTQPSGEVGQVLLGDTNGSHSFTLGGNDITFSTDSGLPLLLKSGAATDFITAPIHMTGGLEVRVVAGSRLDISGNIQDGSSLNKTGAGTLRLTGDYGNASGTFTISAGILVIDSATVQNSNLFAVSIQSGGTLAGSGQVVGATTFASGAVHTPGDSPVNATGSGIQTFTESLAYQSGSIFSWSLTAASTSGRGTSYDGVTGQSGLQVADGTIFRIVSDLDFSTSYWDTQQIWTDIFAVTGTTQGWAVDTLAAVFDGSGMARDLASRGAFSVNGTQVTWNPSVSANPEPASAVVGLLLAGGLLRRKRN